MMARATRSKPSSRKIARPAGQGVDDELGIQFHADHAGGCGQDLVRRQPQQSCAAARQEASATASPVRVAQLALPALTRIAPTRRAKPPDGGGQPHRRGLHAVLREYAGGRGGQSGDDQRQVVLFGSANAGVRGGIAIAKRQIHVFDSPRMSLCVDALAVGEASAAMRLRPSSCTSTQFQRSPSPQTARSGWSSRLAWSAGLAAPAATAISRCARSGRGSAYRRRARAGIRACGCGWSRAGWCQSMSAVLLLQDAARKWPGRRSCFSGAMRLDVGPAFRPAARRPSRPGARPVRRRFRRGRWQFRLSAACRRYRGRRRCAWW